jgi:nicotinamide-nucleotide amidase
MSDNLAKLAEELLKLARDKHLAIVTAESCTAGHLCRILSNADGAAEFFDGGFVTYTKRHKSRALAVSAALLQEKGAVCLDVARAMAQGALDHSEADISVAITGVAGPEPDEDGNPVGRVCIGIAQRRAASSAFERDYGSIGREAIVEAATAEALRALIQAAREIPANP